MKSIAHHKLDEDAQVALISLSRGMFASVDPEDFISLSRYKWSVVETKEGYFYAIRSALPDNNESGQVRMHRSILNAPPNKKVDHINGNGLDNRKCNLRVCTHVQNMRNTKKRKDSQFRFKGIQRCDANTWYGVIHINKKAINLGRFSTEEAAALAYNDAASKYFGEFARLNEVSTSYRELPIEKARRPRKSPNPQRISLLKKERQKLAAIQARHGASDLCWYMQFMDGCEPLTTGSQRVCRVCLMPIPKSL